MFQNFSESAAPAAPPAFGERMPRPLIPRDDYSRLASITYAAAEAGDTNGLRLLARIRLAELRDPGDLPDGIVAMEDFVTYRTASGRSRTRALIYPEDRMWSPAEISVLTPLGTALLGQREGDRVPVEGAAESWNLTLLIERTGVRKMTGGFPRIGTPSSRNTKPVDAG